MERINLIAVTIILVLAIGANINCVENSKTYEGSLIEVDYGGEVVFEDQDWIEIDGVKFTHYRDFGKSLADEYSLAATRTVAEESGKELVTVQLKQRKVVITSS